MLNKQYVSIRLLPIIVAFTLAFGCMTAIQQSDSYADELNYPTTALKVVGATENATWKILKTMPFKENTNPSMAVFEDYKMGDPIERTWNNTGNDGVVPWWSIKLSDLERCGIVTGVSLSKTDGSFINGYYASDLTQQYNGISLMGSDLGEIGAVITMDGRYPDLSQSDSYQFSCLAIGKKNKPWKNSFLYDESEEYYAEVFVYDDVNVVREAKDTIDTVFTIYFNGEERKLLLVDSDMELQVGGTDTRIAKVQSSYYGNATVSYTSSDNTIATVDTTSGEVIGVAEGEATITASIKDGDKETSKSYKVIVSKASDPAVEEVIEKINSIDDPVTLNSEKGITAARQAYNDLGEDQKALIDAAVLKKLTDAEEALKELKAAPVINQIDSIGDITEDNYLQKESDILDAQTAYNALSADIQPFVTNYAKLLEARIVVAEFKLKSAKGDLEKVKKDKKKAEQELQNLKDEIAAKALTVSGLKVTSKAKKFTVKWKKNNKADGYQVQYKLKSAKKYQTLKTLTGTKAVSKKLKKGKKYQFKVRTYRLVNGKTTYGKWCGVKSCACK